MPISAYQSYKAYDRLSAVYDFCFTPFFAHGWSKLGKWVAERSPASILEIGCGTGALLDKYPKYSIVQAIDFSNAMLSEAEKRVLKKGLGNIVLHLMDARQLSFADQSFDAVVLSHVLTTLPDPLRVMQEASRVCRKGGSIFVLNYFNRGSVGELLAKLDPVCSKIGWSMVTRLEDILPSSIELVRSRQVNLFGLHLLAEFVNYNGHAK